MDKRKIYNTYF